jgi:hypothetical protein
MTVIQSRISGPGLLLRPATRKPARFQPGDHQGPAGPSGGTAQASAQRPPQTACGFIYISPWPAQAAQPVWEIPADPALIAGAGPGTCPDGRDVTAFTNPFTAPNKKARRIISGPVTCYFVAGAGFEPATSGL